MSEINKILLDVEKGFTSADTAEAIILDLLSNQSKWISVEDEKPRNLLNVLVCYDFINETVIDKYITRGYYCGNDIWEVQSYNKEIININITHWQYLPEKP